MAKSEIVVPYYEGDNLQENDILVTEQATYIVMGESETHLTTKEIRTRLTQISKQQILSQNPVLVKRAEVLKYQDSPANRAKKTKK